MANVFQYVDWMAMKCLFLVKNKRSISANMSSAYKEEFRKPFAVGDTVRVKKPQRGLIRTGLGYTPQGLQRINATITVQEPFGIDFEWDSFEKAIKMERSEAQLEAEYLDPFMAQIAQEIDSRAALFAYQNSNNVVGVLGTDPATFDATSAAARQRLVELGGANDEGGRVMIVPPNVMRALKGSTLTGFNPNTDLSKAWRTGIVGNADGFEWYESMSLYAHTSGVWAGAVSVATAPTNGATSVALTCTTGDTFLTGDSFDFNTTTAQVNPMTRRKGITVAKPFVVTAPANGVASAATVSFWPPIYGPGSAYQNVDALPAAGAVLTMFRGTAAPTAAHTGINGLAFTKNAFAIVGVPLEKAEGAEVSWTKQDPETGISISFLRMMDPVQRKMINRFDCCLGFGALYSDECSVRILGA